MRVSCSALLAISLLTPVVAQPQEVHTRYGAITGIASQGLRIFKGIPYSTPPTGELRWKRPLPPHPWTGIRQASEFAASCIQPARVQSQSEDCLYLNIWSLPAVRNA